MSQARARAISRALYTEPHVSYSAKFSYLSKRRRTSKIRKSPPALFTLANYIRSLLVLTKGYELTLTKMKGSGVALHAFVE